MGANPTQAMGIICTLLAFTLFAVTMAGGGFLSGIGFLILLGAGVFFFLKCKPWEDRPSDTNGSVIKSSTLGVKA